MDIGSGYNIKRGAVALLLVACWGTAAATPAGYSQVSSVSERHWVTSPTETYKGKRDDIYFVNARVGFYGTGKGDLFRSDDGGASWTKLWSQKGTFIRAIGFIDENNGLFGNVGDYYPGVTDRNALYRTHDGGRSWAPVPLPGPVEGICAIDVLHTRAIYQGHLTNKTIIHAAGRVGGPARLLRSTDGGQTWTYIDLSSQAGMILDVKFLDANTGFVFAGSNSDPAQSSALILKTHDGGKSWRAVYRSSRKLENIWKGAFPDARTGYATVQSYDPAREEQVVVKTTDGGDTWREMPLVRNAKALQFGVGFANVKTGWVGTAVGGFETRDGGKNWHSVPLAPAANKIRVRAGDGTPMIYAIGTQVQRLLPASQR
jgi:photosystem II stability/assembly factor-like uncharacterized protein